MRAAVAICALFISSGVLFAQDTDSLNISKSLSEKGTLVMEVNVGDVRVVRSEEDKTIRLMIDPRGDYDDAAVKRWVRRFDVAGDRASIDLKLPKHDGDNHSGPRVIVSVPEQTDLKLELGVGQLTVKGIEGNKELHVGIGQLTIGVADASKYNDIQTSSKLGQAEDGPSNQHSGGFFPSTHRTSSQGVYKLHATVGIGQVNVEKD